MKLFVFFMKQQNPQTDRQTRRQGQIYNTVFRQEQIQTNTTEDRDDIRQRKSEVRK